MLVPHGDRATAMRPRGKEAVLTSPACDALGLRERDFKGARTPARDTPSFCVVSLSCLTCIVAAAAAPNVRDVRSFEPHAATLYVGSMRPGVTLPPSSGFTTATNQDADSATGNAMVIKAHALAVLISRAPEVRAEPTIS